MSSPLRLEDALVRAAAVEARLNRRSLPKQIEHWADLGRRIAQMISPEDLIKISLGLGRLHVEGVAAPAADVDDVFAQVAARRDRGELSHAVTAAAVSYQAVPGRPGVLERIERNGLRQRGVFRNGEFIAE